MIEGEEEVGSENLGVFVQSNKERLECDAILISDTGIIAKRYTIHHDRTKRTELFRGRSYWT